LIVFTDDDIDPDPSWLNIIVESTDRWPNIRVFGGKVEPVFPYKVNSKIIESEFSSYVFGKYEPYVNEKVCVDTTPVGANCWFRKSIFDDGYVYDPTIGPSGRGRVSGSEMEFFTRLVASGEKIVYVPDALVYHRIQESQLTLKYLLRRSYASGRGWVRVKGREENIVLWFGAPRYMYRIICEKLIEAFAFFLSKKNYLEPLMTISGYLGCIKEYRAGRPAKPEKGE
jgi:GT2 family glycosyltransferase